MAVLDAPEANPNPLAKFPVLESTNIEETQYLISRSFAPYSLDIMSCNESLKTEYHAIFFDNMTLARSSYGLDTLLKPQSDNYFLTHTTLAGHSEVTLDKQTIRTEKGLP